MSSQEIPIETSPRIRTHSSGRYHIRRISFTEIACTILIGFLFVLAIIIFILWLGLRPHRPRIHIRDFNFVGLGHLKGPRNAQVNFNLTAYNPNNKIEVYYDAMHVSLEYVDESIGFANLLNPFYEKPNNVTVLYGVMKGAMLTINRRRWKEIEGDRGKGLVIFRLKLTSAIRFRLLSWTVKHRKMHNICDAAVGSDGLILASFKDKRCSSYFT